MAAGRGKARTLQAYSRGHRLGAPITVLHQGSDCYRRGTNRRKETESGSGNKSRRFRRNQHAAKINGSNVNIGRIIPKYPSSSSRIRESIVDAYEWAHSTGEAS